MRHRRAWQSFQGLDAKKPGVALRAVPVFEEFGLVSCGPFESQSQYARRESTPQDAERPDHDRRVTRLIPHMKVGRNVIRMIHRDHDSEEAADLRHRSAPFDESKEESIANDFGDAR
jgi:hypothetical protein